MVTHLRRLRAVLGSSPGGSAGLLLSVRAAYLGRERANVDTSDTRFRFGGGAPEFLRRTRVLPGTPRETE